MKPYYVIDFIATKCFIDIRVNDVSILCLNIDGTLSSVFPVNSAIVESGKQQVSYNILPLLEETTLSDKVSFTASVWLYDASGDLIEKKEELNKFEMPKNKTGIPLPKYKGEDFFYAEVPYILNAWQNSLDLSEIENLRELVDLAYKKIEDIINTGNYEKLSELIQKREKNIATSLYLSEKEKNQRLKMFIEIVNMGFKVIPVTEKDTMIIYGHDKLVMLKNEEGKSALLLMNENTGEELNLEFQFHLENENEELTII